MKSGGQGNEALAEGAQQYPPTPDRFNRAPQPASPEDMQGMGSAPQSSSQYTPPQPVPEEEPSMGGNRGVADIPNYPRENPLFDEDQPQQAAAKEAEQEAVAQPVFHDNPAFDEKTSGQASFGSPMISNRSSTQAPTQQSTYESSPQVSERTAEPHSGFEDPVQHNERMTTSLDIPPVFDPNNIQPTNQGQQYSETIASGPPAIAPQSVNPPAEQEVGYGMASGQPELQRQLSEPREIPYEERVSTAPATNDRQVFDNGMFEQQGGEEACGNQSSMLAGQREHPSEAVTAANAAVEEEVMYRRQPEVESETVSNAAQDGRAPVQVPFEQQGLLPQAQTTQVGIC